MIVRAIQIDGAAFEQLKNSCLAWLHTGERLTPETMDFPYSTYVVEVDEVQYWDPSTATLTRYSRLPF